MVWEKSCVIHLEIQQEFHGPTFVNLLSAEFLIKCKTVTGGRSKAGSNIFCDCVAETQHFLRVSFAFVFGTCVVCFRTVIGHNVSNFRSHSFARAHHSSFFVKEDMSFRLNRRSKRPSDFLTCAPSCHLT